MDMIDVTIVNVALPTIRRDLHASATQLEWVVSGYMLAFAAALIIAGNLGDLLGRKRIFLFGVAMFGLASLGAGLGGSGRGADRRPRRPEGAAACGWAMARRRRPCSAPSSPGSERGKGVRHLRGDVGFASAVALVSAGRFDAELFGLALGLLRQHPGVGLRADRGAPFRARDPGPGRAAARRARRDPPGRVAAVAIVYPLLEGRQPSAGRSGCGRRSRPGGAGRAGRAGADRGQAPRKADGAAAAGRAVPDPRVRGRAGYPARVYQPAWQGFFLAFALWLQAGEHFSPLKAGLTAVAFSAGSFIGAPVAVPLAQRYGRQILAAGAAGMVAGILGIALAAPHVGTGGSPWPIVPGLAVAGPAWPCWSCRWSTWCSRPSGRGGGGASGLFSTAQQLGAR